MRLIIVLILLISGGFAFSQDPVVELKIVTKNDDTGKKLGGVDVEVYKGEKLFLKERTASNGKAPSVSLPVNGLYKVVLKKEGYVSKLVTFNTNYEFLDDLPQLSQFPMQASLFKKCDAHNYEFLEKEAIINFQFDENGQQSWNHEYTKGMLKKVENAKYNNLSETDHETFTTNYYGGMELMEFYKFEEGLIKLNKAKEIVDCDFVIQKIEECKKGAVKQKSYDEHIQLADKLMAEKKYTEAQKEYAAAHEIWPQEMYPEERLIEIKKILETK